MSLHFGSTRFAFGLTDVETRFLMETRIITAFLGWVREDLIFLDAPFEVVFLVLGSSSPSNGLGALRVRGSGPSRPDMLESEISLIEILL